LYPAPESRKRHSTALSGGKRLFSAEKLLRPTQDSNPEQLR